MAASKNNVRNFHGRPKTINVGIIVFAIIFIYLLITVYLYISKENISIYQITEDGGLMHNNEHSGIILRDEHIVTADTSGYVRYYLPSGEKVAKNKLLYSLDESGDTTKALAKENSYTETIRQMDLTSLKDKISKFARDFTPDDFSTVYDFKTTIAYSMLDLMNYNNLEYLTKLLATVEADNMFNLYYAATNCNVVYYVDGLEQLTPANVKPDNLNKESYKRTTFNTTGFIKKGEAVYKYITNENWNIVFALTEEEAIRYSGLSTLTIYLSNYDMTLTLPFEIFSNETGKYGCFSLDKYLSKFIENRYIEFEIIYEENKGLKIPVSSVVSKDFLILPVDYCFESQGINGFYLETSDAEGAATVILVEPTIYNKTESHYYVDTSAFDEGSYIININTGDRYRIGQKAPLSGVYTVNKGYTLFRKIEIIDQNSEYYIVKKGTRYGTTLYDHIILNGKLVKEGQVIYR